MRRPAAPAGVGATCPADARHGPLLDLDGRTYCPHHDHDAERIVRRQPPVEAPVGAPVPTPRRPSSTMALERLVLFPDWADA
jgi:uncharacterized Zn finger protein (UPF0148 family)